MGTAHVKASRFESQEEIKLAQDFLNKAHGFATITKESLRAVEFCHLAKSALKAGLTNNYEAANEFELDVEKAKRGRSTGISTENRNRFISLMAMRAYDVIEPS